MLNVIFGMHIRVASVQLPFRYFSTPQEFADHVRAPIELAVQHGAQFILLPHLTSFMLFGMFDFDATATDSLDQLAQRQQVSTEEWLNERAGYVFEFYLHLFQSLASRVETWLAPGTVLEPDENRHYLTAFLFNPAGETVGRQRQMHRTSQQEEWGVALGDTLRVFETGLGNFAFVIGEDVHHTEIATALAADGADVLLHPAAGESSELLSLVETNQMFGVQANLVSANFRGRSGIYAPAALTENTRGILAHPHSDTEGELILANLDFSALEQLRAGNPSPKKNLAP